MSHGVFEWVGMALFVWFAFTGILLWQPGYFAWSLLTGGILLLWTLLIFDDIARGVNRVRGNPAYWLLLGCCTIIGGHLLADQYLPQVEASKLSGNVNISMFFHLELIVVGILLAQRLGDISGSCKIFLDVLAGLMILGGGITALAASRGPGRDTLWLISASGICIWIVPLVRVFVKNSESLEDKFSFDDLPVSEKVKIILRLVVAGVATVSLLMISNFFCLGVLAGCIALVGMFHLAAKRNNPIACWAIAVLAGAVIIGFSFAMGVSLDGGILGFGEKGFSFVFAGDGGLSILAATTGWAGMLLVLFGGLAIGASGMLRARRSAGNLALAAVWILATFIASAAWLARGGYVSPTAAIAMAITWGLWPRMVGGKEGKLWPGWVVPICVLAMLGLVAIVKDPGLLWAMGAVCGLKDKGEHLIAGFLFSMVMVWFFGKRYWWMGGIGLLLAAMAGGLAELAQKEFTERRAAELGDWKAHMWGTAAAGVIFAAAMAYRHAMQLAGRGGQRQKRTGVYLSTILRGLVLAGVLAFAAWWSWSVCRAIDHRWKTPKPYIIISDALVTPIETKPLYLPGITNDRTAIIASSVLTSIPGRGNPEFGWQSDKKGVLRIMPKLTNIQPGTVKPWFEGWPFGPLAYVREKGIVTCVPFGRAVLAIDARDAKGWLWSSIGNFRGIMDKLTPSHTVVFVHPGPIAEFRRDRDTLRRNYPNIPCVCDVTFGAGHNRTAYLLKRFLAHKKKPLPPTRVITSDIKFARSFRRYFGKACRADVIGVEPPKTTKKKLAKNPWLRFHPDLKTLVEQQKIQ